MLLPVACAAPPAAGGAYRYSLNPDLAEVYTVKEAPFGAVFYLDGAATGIGAADGRAAAVAFALDEVEVRVETTAGEPRSALAERLAREFRRRGFPTRVGPDGRWLAVASGLPRQVQGWSHENTDQGLVVGSDLIKY